MHVLLVEDERLLRESAAALLRDAGFTVTEAASAEEALALVAGDPGRRAPAVVVTDLHLGPGMDGLAFGQHARRHWPEVGVVYATGHPDGLDGHLLGPRERYVVKPFTHAALLGAVRRLVPVRVLGFSLH